MTARGNSIMALTLEVPPIIDPLVWAFRATIILGLILIVFWILSKIFGPSTRKYKDSMITFVLVAMVVVQYAVLYEAAVVLDPSIRVSFINLRCLTSLFLVSGNIPFELMCPEHKRWEEVWLNS